jgi:hypothetical protein
MEAGLCGPDGDSESFGHLRDGETEVVVENEDRALLDGEPSEGAFELVAMVHGQVLVGAGRWLDGQEPDAFRPLPATPGLGVAGVGQNPMEPGLEAPVVAQGAELAPGRDERGLECVLRQVGVAQDPNRDRHASVSDQASQGFEGFAITLFRAVDQCFLHLSSGSSSVGPIWTDHRGEPWEPLNCSICDVGILDHMPKAPGDESPGARQ